MDADSRVSVVKFDKRWWDSTRQRFNSDDYVYIGRALPHYRLPASVFANVYSIDKNAQDARLERLRVIRLYDAYVDGNDAILDAIRALKARLEINSKLVLKLVCWCKGTQGKDEHEHVIDVPCHGDVLKRRILQFEQSETLSQGKLF